MNSVLTINFPSKKKLDKQNVLVYGAGNAGRQLVTALENSPEFRVVGFLDDDKTIHKQVLFGKTIFLSSELGNLIERKKINLIFLALPSISRNKRNQIIHCLNQFNVRVKTLPSISEIVDGKITVSDIKDLNIDDLLCRDQVKADVKLLNKNVNSQTVLVTGAGGSIGSELCRQIIRLRPKKLILLELSEFALYQIYEELSSLNKNLKIVSLLANTQNQEKLEIIFESFGVNTVYHTAAYKHVPLVEENICEGVKNNVFSTIAVAKASINTKVSNFVFISSDKAVRPTNVMGATKRLSELCVQGIYNYHKNIKTNFSIVRFGNVLLSSGSVIPKFTKQIKDGGPITLTHPEITRYFMTVTEAAQLVIQAGAMGKFCEVFVLDMGKSIKIKNLICNMVSLYGYTIKDITNPSGDIEIKITGLRPGEKLYEELLIGEKPQKTSHKKIKKAEDPFVPYDSLKYELNDLYNLIKYNKTVEVKKMLCSLIYSFQSNTKIVDHIYRHQLKLKNDSKNNFTRIK